MLSDIYLSMVWRWLSVVERGRWSGVDGVECECGVEWRVEWRGGGLAWRRAVPNTRGAVPNTHVCAARADAQLGVRAKIKMNDNNKIIFKPDHTPNVNWVRELDPRHMDETLSLFKASFSVPISCNAPCF